MESKVLRVNRHEPSVGCAKMLRVQNKWPWSENLWSRPLAYRNSAVACFPGLCILYIYIYIQYIYEYKNKRMLGARPGLLLEILLGLFSLLSQEVSAENMAIRTTCSKKHRQSEMIIYCHHQLSNLIIIGGGGWSKYAPFLQSSPLETLLFNECTPSKIFDGWCRSTRTSRSRSPFGHSTSGWLIDLGVDGGSIHSWLDWCHLY